MLIDSILHAVGDTPLLRLARMSSGNVYAKAEFLNPGGSIKDRVALAMIEDAERSGELKPGGTIVAFAPNRLYPFETHGAYFGGRYVFGNIPLVNWLPDPLRDSRGDVGVHLFLGDCDGVLKGQRIGAAVALHDDAAQAE